MSAEHDLDVVVVGAGPAGACAATLLAQAGLRVGVFERERFPRFHIGESLLPSCVPVLAAMGIDLDAGGYLRKQGAEFYDERTGEYAYFAFADALPGLPHHAYQVDRASFDDALAAAAREAGASVEFGVTVLAHAIDDRGVELQLVPTPEGLGPDEGHVRGGISRGVPSRAAARTVRARYLVDASGRRGLTSRGGREHDRVPGLGKAASFLHFDGLGDAAWAELAPRGDVKVLRMPDGWIWAIPLADRRLSVGLVSRAGAPDDADVARELAGSPMLTRLTAGARRSSLRAIADYSYVNRSPHGARFVAIGDAAGFLDPVFSSGVAIALSSAQRMAAHVVAAFADDAVLASPTLMESHRAALAVAYRTFHCFAHRFYNGRLIDNLLLGEAPDANMRAGLISILAGDIWRDDNRFQRAVLSATRHELPVMPWADAR